MLITPQSELKQAKQQSQDLHRTSEFFGALLTQQPEEKAPKPTSDGSAEEPQTNGYPVPPKMDPMSPFSQPPAPPPQQPLPEKPDVARSNNHDSFIHPPLKRTATEKPTLGTLSPTKTESSSQILSLVEALTSAKKEIDSQGDRVKQLEDLLRQERKARESAEERARRLENHQPGHLDGDGTSDKRTIWDDSEELQRWTDLSTNSDPIETTEARAASDVEPDQTSYQSPEEIHQETAAVDASTSRLQQRLDLMLAEMDDMKLHMDRYKRRAEQAEEDSTTTRQTLAEMIETIRAGDHRDGIIRPHHTDGSSPINAHPDLTSTDLVHDISAAIRSSGLPNRTVLADHKQLQQAVATALAGREPGRGGESLHLSAPYASMLGVVLIGVGIMTWLNGWQKVER